MEILFLGTGSAWCVPEYSCDCVICSETARLGEERTRTCFLVRGSETLLVDCGPDIRRQMLAHNMECPDAILITHEHGDHYLGLDDLLAFRRARPRGNWTPIPVYATEQTWNAVEIRFGYLLGSLLEKRTVMPGEPLQGLKAAVTPFKTEHGAFAKGSVGYVIEDAEEGVRRKLVYTSDFISMENEPQILENPDMLIMQSHWLNEPLENRPHHMSFQNAMDYIRRWNPRSGTYLVHISAGDTYPGDPRNDSVKKWPPKSPLRPPAGGEPYPIPRCHAEWRDVIDRIAEDYNLPRPIRPAFDGLRVRV